MNPTHAAGWGPAAVVGELDAIFRLAMVRHAAGMFFVFNGRPLGAVETKGIWWKGVSAFFGLNHFVGERYTLGLPPNQ